MSLKSFLRKRNESVLFINPDYHCTFFYQEALRQRGWKVDILVTYNYPQNLIYDSSHIIRLNRRKNLAVRGLLDLLVFGLISWRYRHHVYYGRPLFLIQSSRISKFLFGKREWNIFLSLSKQFKAKIVYVPSGCKDEFTQEHFSHFDNGNICGNCAFIEYCSDDTNKLNLDIMGRYSDMIVGAGFFQSPSLEITPMKWKVIDLNKWSPNIEVPLQFKLPPTDALRIFHSRAGGLRDLPGKNIKGTYFLIDAVNKLKSEGFKIEIIEVKDIHSSDVKFFQIQADVVVDQLIYGQWGSIGIESMALGIPTICYIRESWKQEFLSNFPEYQELPILQSNEREIYYTLRNLLENPSVLLQYSVKARLFAERHFSIPENTDRLVKILHGLT